MTFHRNDKYNNTHYNDLNFMLHMIQIKSNKEKKCLIALYFSFRRAFLFWICLFDLAKLKKKKKIPEICQNFFLLLHF